jgi:hypothetical protein
MRRTFWVLAAVVLAALLLTTDTAEANNIITVPDIGADVGQHTSLVRDSSGKPVMSYYDATNGDLKVVHCGDINCGPKTITLPDTAGDVGRYTSLALDGSGYPVVSYYDATNHDLKVMHCNDDNCDPNVNGAESKISFETGGDIGQYTSLVLDTLGRPVVSYYDASNGDLKVLHCTNSNCSAGNITNTPDSGGDVGQYTSLALDDNTPQRPVVSYYDVTNGNLKVLHCGDADCSSGNSITSPDTENVVGAHTSLALDGNTPKRPVISYYYAGTGDLKVLHCDDANCAGNESANIVSPDTAGAVGAYSSLAMYAGNPTVAYYDLDNGDLKVLRCGDANCSSGNSIASVDTEGVIGAYTSLALDSSGYPSASYYDADHGMLKFLRCWDASCTSGQMLARVDWGGDIGAHISLALDSGGRPVVSYQDAANDDLKVMHCNDANCAGGDESIVSPDTVGIVGETTSLALDSGGNPVISYSIQVGMNFDLKVMHCNDPNCAGDNEIINTPDTGDAASVGTYTSLLLDGSGRPVVAYGDYDNADLKVLHCNDVNCAAGGDSITTPDTSAGVGLYTSLALDAAGNPVVSYWQSSLLDLRVLHCDDVNCSGDESGHIASPDTTDSVGMYTSLLLDASGYPVVSYYDYTNKNLKVLHCGNANCTAGNSITSPDTPGDVGGYSSLPQRLDGSGNPVVSYFDSTNGDLKVLHCDTPNCATPASYPPAGTDVLPVSLSFEHVYLCAEGGAPPCLDVGAATFSGTGQFVRGIPYLSGGYNTIDTEVRSMVLTGTVYGDQVTIKAGTLQGLSASTGKIREQTPGTLYPADTWFDLFFKVESSDSNYDDTQNCNFGGGAQAVRFTGVTMDIPAKYVEYHVPSCPLEPPPADCVAGCGESGLLAVNAGYDEARYYCAGGSGQGVLSVGGIAERPDTAAGPDSLADSSAGSGFNYTALCAALGAAAVALAAGAWFARRRWAR